MTDTTDRDSGSMKPEPVALLEIDSLRTWVDGGTSIVRAVDSVGLVLVRGETLALLGESGCGAVFVEFAEVSAAARARKVTRILDEGSR